MIVFARCFKQQRFDTEHITLSISPRVSPSLALSTYGRPIKYTPDVTAADSMSRNPKRSVADGGRRRSPRGLNGGEDASVPSVPQQSKRGDRDASAQQSKVGKLIFVFLVELAWWHLYELSRRQQDVKHLVANLSGSCWV